MKRILNVRREEFSLKEPFKIAHGTKIISEVIYVELIEGNYKGVAESVPYARYGESCNSVIEQIEGVRTVIEQGITRFELQDILAHGAARNALDCALWDLAAQQQQKPLWEIAQLPNPRTLKTAYTLVINKPDLMARQAANLGKKYPILKLKLAGDKYDEQRIIKVRQAAKHAMLILDANEAITAGNFAALLDICIAQNVAMVEQPFKVGQDDILLKNNAKITICADESCHIAADLEGLRGKYNMINIKLDKAGGLTEAIKLYQQARALNFKIMVGCMVGSSLSLLPAYYLAAAADLVDLDAALLLKKDRGLLKYIGNELFV